MDAIVMHTLGRLRAGLRWFWFSPLPVRRAVLLRRILSAFIFVDVLLTTRWVALHVDAPQSFYQPLLVARLLHLPRPTPALIIAVEVLLLVCAAVAAAGRLPRVAGYATFVLYFIWMLIAMSYGKVDHDRFAFLVALAVLPTVREGDDDRASTEEAGWALRCIQVAVVLTYFLAAVSKLRYGGIAWLNGGTLLWAVLRRGTIFADPLIDNPWTLKVAQWGIVAFEFISPLLLVPGRIGRWLLLIAVAFHVGTFATITIIFLPHIMCLLAFVPLERLGRFRKALPSSEVRTPAYSPQS
jgi:hypothetical protein